MKFWESGGKEFRPRMLGLCFGVLKCLNRPTKTLKTRLNFCQRIYGRGLGAAIKLRAVCFRPQSGRGLDAAIKQKALISSSFFSIASSSLTSLLVCFLLDLQSFRVLR